MPSNAVKSFGKHYSDWGLKSRHIFLDSPLAIEATEIYLNHSELFDKDATQFFREHRHPPLLPNLHFAKSAEESMALNTIRSGAIIIAGSGMCNGGRIKHHLKHNVWRRDCHIIIVGYQVKGTLGRALVNGAKHIRLWGETIRVEAQVHTIGGLSAHADQAGLLAWYSHFQNRPSLILVHGEPQAMQALEHRIRDEIHSPVHIAKRGEIADLAALPNF